MIMKKILQLLIIVFLLFPLNMELERSAFVNELKEISSLSVINLHPETTQCHSERSEESPVDFEVMRFFVTPFLKPVLEQREGMTLEGEISDWTATNTIDSFNRFSPFNLINPINSFNQSLAWSQNSEPESATRIPTNYVIGSGDVLEIFVWRNEQLSREVVVRPDGKISLPLIQDVQAEGLTVPWLKEEITRRFGEYLENPRVTVIVRQIGSYRVSVLGRVVRPGVYPITGNTTLVEAISMAGGFTEWANKGKITVITTEGGEETKLTVNYKKIASGKDPSQNIVLKRGDTIIVP